MCTNNKPVAQIRVSAGFSLLEMLVVIAIVGIMAALLLPHVSPLRGTAGTQVARQQQAELQTALGAWIAHECSKPGGLAATKVAYGDGGLQLLEDYLQPATLSNLTEDGSSVTSEALKAAGAHLEFSAWGSAGPSVEWKTP